MTKRKILDGGAGEEHKKNVLYLSPKERGTWSALKEGPESSSIGAIIRSLPKF